MAFNNFFDKFRQAPTPEAEQRKTTMQLLDDEKFLDFLDKVEAQSGTRVFAGLSLDEPATDELMEYHGRYKEQQKVAEQMVGGVKQEFREAGLRFDESLKLPSNKPYRERFVAFFYPALGSELADATAALPDNLKAKLDAAKLANVPDSQDNHPGGTEAEDVVADELRTDFEAYRAELGNVEASISKMKVDAGLSKPSFSNLADDHAVVTELTAMEGKLNAFVIEGVTSPHLVDIVEKHRTELKRIVDAERAKVVGGAPAPSGLATELATIVQAQEDSVARQMVSDERSNLDTVQTALTEVYQAKETMGSRMDAIRAQVQEQAISNPYAFDSLKEEMAALEAKDKEVQGLRKQMEQHGLDVDPDANTRRLMDLRSSLNAVNKYGTNGSVLGTVYRMTSRKFRDAEQNLVANHKMGAGRDRKSIQEDIAQVESILASGSNLQMAKSGAESIASQIKADIPAIDGLGGAINVALRESLKSKLTKGDLSGIDAARKQIENASYATLINGEVDVDQIKQMIEDESRNVFQKNLLEQLEAKGGKNISTILRGFENLAAKLQSTRSIESANLLTFIKDSLDGIAGDLSLNSRTRQYAELIRNTVAARYS